MEIESSSTGPFLFCCQIFLLHFPSVVVVGQTLHSARNGRASWTVTITKGAAMVKSRHVTRDHLPLPFLFGHMNYRETPTTVDAVAVARTTPYGRQASLIHPECDRFIYISTKDVIIYSCFECSLPFSFSVGRVI